MDSILTDPSLENVNGRHHAIQVDSSRFRLAAAVVWTVVIMVLCWLPSGVVHELPDESSWFEIPNFDKLVHGESSWFFPSFGFVFGRPHAACRSPRVAGARRSHRVGSGPAGHRPRRERP